MEFNEKIGEEEAPVQEKISTPKMRTYITKEYRIILKDNKTTLDEILKNYEGKDKNELLNYLAVRGVVTVGDYVLFCSVRKARNTLLTYVTIHKIKDIYHKMHAEVVNYGEKLAREMLLVRRKIMAAQIRTVAEQAFTTDGEDFFEELKQIPCSHFVKDSTEMDVIRNKYRDHLDNLTKGLVESGISEEKLKIIFDKENEKYRPIVDSKREQYERETRKASASYTQDLITESIKYHHKSNHFDQESKHEGHKHFPEHAREL